MIYNKSNNIRLIFTVFSFDQPYRVGCNVARSHSHGSRRGCRIILHLHCFILLYLYKTSQFSQSNACKCRCCQRQIAMLNISHENHSPTQADAHCRPNISILFYFFSLISEVPVLQAFLPPRFLPLLTSLREAQQQVKQSVISHAMIAKPDAIHMNTNIRIPRLASIFSCVTDVMAFFMMMNITVAMTVATVVQSAPKKVRIMMKSVAQRVNTAMGTIKIITKFRQMPVMKRPNIQ